MREPTSCWCQHTKLSSTDLNSYNQSKSWFVHACKDHPGAALVCGRDELLQEIRTEPCSRRAACPDTVVWVRDRAGSDPRATAACDMGLLQYTGTVCLSLLVQSRHAARRGKTSQSKVSDRSQRSEPERCLAHVHGTNSETNLDGLCCKPSGLWVKICVWMIFAHCFLKMCNRKLLEILV